MSRSNFVLRLSAVLALIVLFTVPMSTAYGQNYNNNGNSNNNSNNRNNGNSNNNNGNNRNNGNSNNNNNSNSGNGSSYGSGVVVNANGVLERVVLDDGVLAAARNEAYRAIPSEMRAASKLRKVSLNRLEAQIKANDGVVTDEMANLAGLTRIENVFIYDNDVVIAGPAEGWKVGSEGATVGLKSGRPTLQLEDLVVALRAYPAEGKGASLVGCSIDPTEEGLRSMQSYLNTAAQPTNDLEVVNYAAGIRDALGLQNVTVWGVSPKTNFAATLVAADYRMKLIGIGLETAPVKLVTYAEKSNPRNAASNALVRWYFQPNYDCVVETEDGNAMQLVGNGVNLLGEDELVGADGSRSANKGKGNPATRAYAKSFTQKFESIADQVPVYANLRNLIDMTIVAAYLQKEGAYAKANWNAELFSDEAQFQTENLNEIQFAQTAVNTIRRSANTTSYPTGGGVSIEPQIALDNMKYDEKGLVEAKREKAENNDTNNWWWD